MTKRDRAERMLKLIRSGREFTIGDIATQLGCTTKKAGWLAKRLCVSEAICRIGVSNGESPMPIYRGRIE